MTILESRLALARQLIPVARAAGAIERRYYESGTDVIDKLDGSPVTAADQEAEALIMRALTRLSPDIPVVGEEATAADNIPDISAGRFFLVDPLDGTKEFITGGGDFTVNIALLENFRPVMGVIYAPVSDILWYGALAEDGGGAAFMQQAGAEGDTAHDRPMRVREAPAEGLTVVGSKRHDNPDEMDEFLRPYKIRETIKRSSSLKFCAIAAGDADIYPRLSPTSEWDTAAGEAIVHAAGGVVTQIDGQPMVYGKADVKFLNGRFVVRAHQK